MTDDDPRREKLLAAVIEHVLLHGVGSLSLRPLAAAIGTSHRMLLYHFGTKDDLLLAVVQAVEAAQQQAAAAITADQSMSPEDQLRAFWRRVSDPALAPNARLFFELYGRGLNGAEPAARLLDGDIRRWAEPAARLDHQRHGTPLGVARDEARLALAVVRGLLLDLLATGERPAVDRAFERFVNGWSATRSSASPTIGRAPGRTRS